MIIKVGGGLEPLGPIGVYAYDLSAITLTNIYRNFLPTRWRQKLTGIDMEQNYVTVTLSI